MIHPSFDRYQSLTSGVDKETADVAVRGEAPGLKNSNSLRLLSVWLTFFCHRAAFWSPVMKSGSNCANNYGRGGGSTIIELQGATISHSGKDEFPLFRDMALSALLGLP